MKSLEMIRDYVRACPQSPGVYLIKDVHGTPIYIGKAISLRARLSQHFIASRPADFKTQKIREYASCVNIIQTSSEAEALLLESSLIKEYQPKYNQELKDDKSYPYLKITEEEFPRLVIVRGRKSDGSRYFGPYTNARLLRQALSLLRRLFPMRICRTLPKKPCLMFHIGQCPGPCVDAVSGERYGQTVKELVMFLDGRRDALVRNLSRRMKDASAEHRFEEAALYRDQIQALSAVAVKKSGVDRSSILTDLRSALKLSRVPVRIEAFDISNFAGKNPVGSMVVFEDGEPLRSEYRRFKIKNVRGVNDYDMMREIVRRRYERLLNERRPLPDLVLIDGGRGHLSSAVEELERLNLTDLDLVSIAKQHEHLFKSDRQHPYVLPQSSPILQLLRHVRDEAHRFAVQFYRRLHKKEMAGSSLDGIPGLGPKRRAALLKRFRHVSAIRRAKAAQIAEVPGINARTAKNIEEYLKRG